MTLDLRAVEAILQEARELADYVSEGPLHRQPTIDRMATLLRQLCEATETRNAHCRALRVLANRARFYMPRIDGVSEVDAVLAQATDKEGQ